MDKLDPDDYFDHSWPRFIPTNSFKTILWEPDAEPVGFGNGSPIVFAGCSHREIREDIKTLVGRLRREVRKFGFSNIAQLQALMKESQPESDDCDIKHFAAWVYGLCMSDVFFALTSLDFLDEHSALKALQNAAMLLNALYEGDIDSGRHEMRSRNAANATALKRPEVTKEILLAFMDNYEAETGSRHGWKKTACWKLGITANTLNMRLKK